MQCVRIVNRFSTLIILLMGGHTLAAGVHIRSYVLPVYPATYNRARIQGTFEVQVEVENGRVKQVLILSHNVRSPARRLEKPVEMIRAIQDALRRWEVDQADAQESLRFELSVEFRLADKVTDATAVGYTFRVQEKDTRPSKIIIEADKLGSDIETHARPSAVQR